MNAEEYGKRKITIDRPTWPLTEQTARAAQPPRRRRDAGSLRVGQRDIVGMAWTAEQATMRIDQLATIFGAIDGRTVSTDAARKSISRWVDQGWATSRVLLHGEPAFVWLTPAGIRTAGMDYPGVEPALATLAHTRITTDIRIHLLSRYPQTRWRSERAMRALLPQRQRGQHQPHLPDGEIHGVNGAIIAVENELTAKTVQRTQNIMLGLLSRRYDYDHSDHPAAEQVHRYRAVWYYVNQQTRSVVETARDQLPGDYQERLHIVDWPRP